MVAPRPLQLRAQPARGGRAGLRQPHGLGAFARRGCASSPACVRALLTCPAVQGFATLLLTDGSPGLQMLHEGALPALAPARTPGRDAAPHDCALWQGLGWTSPLCRARSCSAPADLLSRWTNNRFRSRVRPWGQCACAQACGPAQGCPANTVAHAGAQGRQPARPGAPRVRLLCVALPGGPGGVHTQPTRRAGLAALQLANPLAAQIECLPSCAPAGQQLRAHPRSGLPAPALRDDPPERDPGLRGGAGSPAARSTHKHATATWEARLPAREH